ncbi:MAG TPA: thiolase family protein [Acidimicrobiales bacterium]|nr:thiolase family protein [Acidimicrobiales bacterium]
MSAVISGVGTSFFGKQAPAAPELAATAIDEALTAAGIGRGDVEQAFVGNVFGGPGIAQQVLRAAGIAGIPVLRVEQACASGTTALHLAQEAVRSGQATTVLALGVEKMSDRIRGAIPPEADDEEGRTGMPLPGMYAMSARRYLDLYGVTIEDLAMVSVKNHRHAMANSRAQYSGSFTVEDVLDSRMIADPLTLLQCSAIADGAAAAVVQAPAAVAGGASPVGIRSSAWVGGGLWPSGTDHVWNFELIEATAAKAYAEAGVRPSDVDVLEVHDAFTIGELVTLEALGLADVGKGHHLLRDGQTFVGGRQPVNPSGGLLSRGHPIGATGLAQVAEVYWQLTGQAAGRQVPGARLGLVETMGGNMSGLSGNGCVVLLLEGARR